MTTPPWPDPSELASQPLEFRLGYRFARQMARRIYGCRPEDVATMRELCTAMATFLQNLEDWTTLPDDEVVLGSRSLDGTGELRITAGMIRRANNE